MHQVRPGGSGNISSADAIRMPQAMGYDTGVDLDRLLAVARQPRTRAACSSAVSNGK